MDFVWFVKHFCSLFLYLHPTYQPPLGICSSFYLLRILTFCCLSLGSTPPLSSCQIDWHKGKDVTVKTIKKKQKHKGRGTVRTVTKQVPNDSFFNFFNPVKGEDTHNAHTFDKHTQKIVCFSEGWNVTFKACAYFSHKSNHWDSKLNSASCVVTALEHTQIYQKLCRVQPHANTPAGQSACLMLICSQPGETCLSCGPPALNWIQQQVAPNSFTLPHYTSAVAVAHSGWTLYMKLCSLIFEPFTST